MEQTNEKKRNFKRKKKNYSCDEQVAKFKEAVHAVYDKDKSNLENLMNGCIKECEFDRKSLLDLIKGATTLPYYFSDSINNSLGTRYTNKDFSQIIEEFTQKESEAILKYIEDTYLDKKIKTSAEQMRDELNAANEAFEKIRQQKETRETVKQKPTLWQRIKKLFKCK